MLMVDFGFLELVEQGCWVRLFYCPVGLLVLFYLRNTGDTLLNFDYLGKILDFLWEYELHVPYKLVHGQIY